MASITKIPSSGHIAIRFRYGGKEVQRSLKTKRLKEALAIKGRVEETIILLERGRMEIPVNSDPGTFILSDGKRNGTPAPIVTVGSVGQLFDAFKKGRIV